MPGFGATSSCCHSCCPICPRQLSHLASGGTGRWPFDNRSSPRPLSGSLGHWDGVHKLQRQTSCRGAALKLRGTSQSAWTLRGWWWPTSGGVALKPTETPRAVTGRPPIPPVVCAGCHWGQRERGQGGGSQRGAQPPPGSEWRGAEGQRLPTSWRAGGRRDGRPDCQAGTGAWAVAPLCGRAARRGWAGGRGGGRAEAASSPPQVREGVPPQLSLHWQLPDPVPPSACEGPLLLPAAGQGRSRSDTLCVTLPLDVTAGAGEPLTLPRVTTLPPCPAAPAPSLDARFRFFPTWERAGAPAAAVSRERVGC